MSGPSAVGAFEKSAGRPKRVQRKKLPSPFSIRFTEEERARLSRDAGKLALGTYIRQKLLGGDAVERKPQYRRRRRHPAMDREILARLLATLGQSELATSMIAIALAAQSGAMPVTPKLSEKLDAACDDIRAMRIDLIEGLGIKPEGGQSSFAKASED